MSVREFVRERGYNIFGAMTAHNALMALSHCTRVDVDSQVSTTFTFKFCKQRVARDDNYGEKCNRQGTQLIYYLDGCGA